jgi:hypothetical protein
LQLTVTGRCKGGRILFPGKAVKATGWCGWWAAKTEVRLLRGVVASSLSAVTGVAA